MVLAFLHSVVRYYSLDKVKRQPARVFDKLDERKPLATYHFVGMIELSKARVITRKPK